MRRTGIVILVVTAWIFALACGPSNTGNEGPENTADACQDGEDNDGDGLTDCEDDECADFVFCAANPDAAVPDAFVLPDSGPLPDAGSCVTATGQGVNVVLPVDIIWAVDTSGSMDQEASMVEDRLNDFAGFIDQTGLDYHVIMIASNDICVPPPLGGPGCTDSATYRHVVSSVDSQEAYSQILATYPQYQDFLRPNAKISIVVVSDDNDNMDNSTFQSQLAALTNPGFPSGFVFDCIVATDEGIPVVGCCGWQGCGAAIGTRYLDLASSTGGLSGSICNNNWTGIFNAIANNVATDTVLPCNYVIPDPGGGQQVDPAEVNVEFTPVGGTPSTIPYVTNVNGCGSGGWYYDNALDPTEVILCPETCSSLGQGELNVVFGCATIVQ